MSMHTILSKRSGLVAGLAVGFGLLLAGCQQNPPEATQQNG